MAVDEAQLETWSAQGSVQQSAATYKSISGVLNDSGSPYYPKNFDTFLQGSYGNDTNVWADSDVDIVIRLSSVYYSETSELSANDKANFDKGGLLPRKIQAGSDGVAYEKLWKWR